MWMVVNFVLCGLLVVVAQEEVNLKIDRLYYSVPHNERADLECCYTTNLESLKSTWIVVGRDSNRTVAPKPVSSSDTVTMGEKKKADATCGTLSFKTVQMSDTGFYQCLLNSSEIKLSSHGTYLHVYKPLEKTINLSERTKNRILTVEGIFLLLCVLLPATSLLCQSKRTNELLKKKVTKEEENIYQGLNLDDVCPAYEKIERSHTNGPYQDVCNAKEEDIQLEKP